MSYYEQKISDQIDGGLEAMKQIEIINGNKLIAEFMGWEAGRYHTLPNKLHKTENGEEIGIHSDSLQYHSSWDWIMPVIEKIGRIKCNEYKILFEMSYGYCHFYQRFNASHIECNTISSFEKDSTLDTVWLAVIEFIKWHKTTQC